MNPVRRVKSAITMRSNKPVDVNEPIPVHRSVVGASTKTREIYIINIQLELIVSLIRKYHHMHKKDLKKLLLLLTESLNKLSMFV